MSADTAVESAERKGGMGCFAKGCIICALLAVVLAIGGGFFVYTKGKAMVRHGLAFGVDKISESMFENLKLPAQEKRQAMAAVKELSDKIRSGEITMQQGTAIAQEVAKGPVSVVIVCLAFQGMYLQKSKLDPAAKRQGRITVSRFAWGLAQGKISRAQAAPVLDIVTEPSSNNPDQKRLKQTISEQELARCLAIMAKEAEAAGIANREFKIDLAAEIRKAIARGLQAQAAKSEAGGAKNPDQAPAR